MPLNPTLSPALSFGEKIYMSVIPDAALINKLALDLADTDQTEANTGVLKHFIAPIFSVVGNSEEIGEFAITCATCQMIMASIRVSNPKQRCPDISSQGEREDMAPSVREQNFVGQFK